MQEVMSQNTCALAQGLLQNKPVSLPGPAARECTLFWLHCWLILRLCGVRCSRCRKRGLVLSHRALDSAAAQSSPTEVEEPGGCSATL